MEIGGLLGLYGGMLLGMIGWSLGRKKARKNRGLDEVYQHIWQKARSYSWYITLAAIYVLFSLVIFGIEMSPAMILGILLLSHLGSWGVLGIAFNIHLSAANPFQVNRLKFTIIISLITFALFTFLSIFTGQWMFLLMSIPAIVAVTIINLTKQKEEE